MKFDLHVSFDLDGTLIDSLGLMEEGWMYATSRLGIDVRFSEYKKYIGMPFKEIVKRLGLEGECKDLYDLYFGFNYNNMEMIQLNDGAEDLLSYLDAREIGWSIITSKPRINAIAILDQFNINANYLVCPDDVANGKPYPDSMDVLKKMASIECAKIYYVGDMLSDLQFSIESDVDYIHYVSDEANNLSKNIMNKYYRVDKLMQIREIVDK